jgi:hypothetical protein
MGGMVEMFVNEEKKVRLRVSKRALAQGKLSLSPSLTRLAEIIASIEWLPILNEDWMSRTDHNCQPRLLTMGPYGGNTLGN